MAGMRRSAWAGIGVILILTFSQLALADSIHDINFTNIPNATGASENLGINISSLNSSNLTPQYPKGYNPATDQVVYDNKTRQWVWIHQYTYWDALSNPLVLAGIAIVAFLANKLTKKIIKDKGGKTKWIKKQS
ncbi:Uncharacterised protein [uncultured archaeon]|nr:Uncharacterised protein [uncultured archaeon]